MIEYSYYNPIIDHCLKMQGGCTNIHDGMIERSWEDIRYVIRSVETMALQTKFVHSVIGRSGSIKMLFIS